MTGALLSISNCLLLILCGHVYGSAWIGWNPPALIDVDTYQPAGSSRLSRREAAASKVVGRQSSSSLTEFLERVERVVLDNKSVTNYQLANCTHNLTPYLTSVKPCYVVSAGQFSSDTTDYPTQQDFGRYYNPEASLLSILYLTTKSITQARNLIHNGVDFAMVALDQDPGCTIMYGAPESLTNTMIGPGVLSISEGQATILTQMWTAGVKVSVYTSAVNPKGTFEVTPSADYRGSYETTKTSLINHDFRARPGTTCTPTLVRYVSKCNRVTARVIYGREGKVWSNRVYILPDILLPMPKEDNKVFSSVVGCVDYSKPEQQP